MRKLLSIILPLMILLVLSVDFTLCYSVSTPMIVCESVECQAKNQIKVDVTIVNNPGIYYLEVTPVYGPELKLVKVANGTLFSELTTGKQYIWIGDSDVHEDGLLMTFTFEVGEEVAVGDYEVSFILRTCGNYNEESVSLTVVPGKVSVTKDTTLMIGDLDLDGDVDAYDLTLLARHVGGIELLADPVTLYNADTDGDGDVDAYDLTIHARYVGGIITDWEQN